MIQSTSDNTESTDRTVTTSSTKSTESSESTDNQEQALPETGNNDNLNAGLAGGIALAAGAAMIARQRKQKQ